jgi:isopenicillin-N epimerase
MTIDALSLPIPELAGQFLLRQDMSFLNHGSFGACPRPVFDAYQAWQRELEAQPVEFLGRRLPGLLADARGRLAGYIGTQADNLAFVPNATHGINIVARALELQPGDEVLSTDHEYGAVERTWRFNCDPQGARFVTQSIELPARSAAEVVDQLWAGVTERTRVLLVSHISSPTALIFPVAEICRRARAAGIITVVDGAHAPGHIDLDLDAIGADFYSGNCHKWLCAPKGAGFLYARPERQPLLRPLVVSWGWQKEQPGPSPFVDYFEWIGTDDPAAYLSVPAAIDFQAQNSWPAVRAACHALLAQARARIAELTGLPQICPDSSDWWGQMATIPLPPCDAVAIQRQLWDEFRVEVPFVQRGGRQFIRISIQAYNTPNDIDRLVDGLKQLLLKA